ncbi:MAG TPA: hypothetical protein VM076_10155 [Gemmatimonadaceae bacterium]|nr:hypothetical protein [Gemmatimonadaceae bacterium]
MRALPASVIALGIALSGCREGLPTTGGAESTASLSRSSGTITTQPLSASCETSFDAPPLPPPPVLRQVDNGTCQMTHLGRAAFHAVQDIDLASGTQSSIEVTFTAANGDILRASSTGTSTPNGPGVAFNAVMTFAGGTGRFAHASGSARVVGTASFITNSSTFKLVDGSISF